SVTGTPATGQTLNASTGSWSGTTPMSYAYQWRRCDSSGASCAAIAGATGSSYSIVGADAGSTLGLQVSALNGGGQATATSVPTAAVGTTSRTFSGTLSKSVASQSFPVTVGAGTANATLTLAKGTSVTLKLVSSSGAVAGQSSASSSPL